MPFVEVNVKEEIEHKRQSSPEFRKAWDESREEYRKLGEKERIRKKALEKFLKEKYNEDV